MALLFLSARNFDRHKSQAKGNLAQSESIKRGSKSLVALVHVLARHAALEAASAQCAPLQVSSKTNPQPEDACRQPASQQHPQAIREAVAAARNPETTAES